MRDESRDILRLEHIQDAIYRLLNASENEDFFSISDKSLEFYGVIKLLEIIGEAAYKLSNEFKENHPDTPWKIVVGMRHVLVHGYYQINKEDVFKTIKEDLPILKSQIDGYIASMQE